MSATATVPATVPLLSLARQNRALGPAIKKAVARVLDSGVFIMGPEGRAFETEFASALSLSRALGVDSGTSALELALRAVGVGPGDEVIVPSFTFIATATAVSAVGATPVIVDVDENTLTLSAEEIERRATAKTKAVIPVHIFGQPAEMDDIMAMASRRRLTVVEDCAQAHLTTYKGRAAGSIGAVAAFSFYPSKNLGAAGDAGAVATGDPALFKALEELRNCGREPGVAYKHARVGHNCRLDEVQAAVLRVKLKQLAAWTERRRKIAKLYCEELAGLPLRLPELGDAKTKPSFHLFVVRSERRDELAEFLKKSGIGTGVYYPIPVHLQPAYAELGMKPGSLPISERASREALALPMFPELTDAEAKRVCREVRRFFGA